jgi:DNA-binding response OmpR family regulator
MMNNIFESRILVVDDEPDLRMMIANILKQEGFEHIFTAEDCAQARRLFTSIKPDGVILDVMLPDGDGFSLMSEFRMISPVPILFLSARDQDEDRLLGLGLGADDYITKPFLHRELLLRLKSVLNRAYFPVLFKQVNHKPIFYLQETRVDLNSGTITVKDALRDEQRSLTAKEFVILEKLYENRGRIVTGDSLCHAVWGDGLYGYENSLMVHIRRLREKLEPEPSKPRYLLTVRGLGYKLKLEDEQ